MGARVTVESVTKSYGGRPRHRRRGRSRRRLPDARARQLHGAPRSLGLRQVDAPEPPRRARPPDDGANPRGREGPRDAVRGRARRVPAEDGRHDLPVLQPPPDDDRARERRAPAPPRRSRPRRGRRARRARAPRSSGSATGSARIRTSSRAGRCSAWRWRGRSRTSPRSSSPTSRPATSTRRPASRSSRSSRASSHERGITVVMATHSAEAAARASRVVRLRDGQLVP